MFFSENVVRNVRGSRQVLLSENIRRCRQVFLSENVRR